MIKYLFDRFFAFLGLIILSPVFIVLGVWVGLDSKGGVFFIQRRIGKDGKAFGLVKFRTMVSNAEKSGKLTVGSADRRITRAGKVLRKYKLDELPQLWNVLVAEMSFVGPRPEVPEYVAEYSNAQRRVLSVRPGITDEASIAFFDENELLAKSDDPQKTYIEEIMPEKIRLNLEYLDRRSFLSDLRVIVRTLARIFS